MAVGAAPVALARAPAGPVRAQAAPGPTARGRAGQVPGPAVRQATAPAAMAPMTVPATPADMARRIAVPTIAAGCGAMTIRPAMTAAPTIMPIRRLERGSRSTATTSR